MRRVGLAFVATILATSAELRPQLHFSEPHGQTLPRTNLERAFVACWFAEMEPLGMLGSLSPPPQWVWVAINGRNERGYGVLLMSTSRFDLIANFLPKSLDHVDMMEPMWSWVAFATYQHRMFHGQLGTHTEPPTVENMVKSWAIREGWEASPVAEAYWQRARRFVF